MTIPPLHSTVIISQVGNNINSYYFTVIISQVKLLFRKLLFRKLLFRNYFASREFRVTAFKLVHNTSRSRRANILSYLFIYLFYLIYPKTGRAHINGGRLS
jgi:hypothetical protein